MKMINFRAYINPLRARKKRYQRICRLVGLKSEHKVLDIGCGEGLSFEAFNQKNRIVGLDIFPRSKISQKNFHYRQGDASNQSHFKEQEFDLVVCIGVLEHIFPFKKLKKITREIQRIGKGYIVIVPHFYTPFEPHSQLPFWQHYPERLKSSLIKHFSVGYFPKNPQGRYEKLNYLKKNQWQTFFPGSTIIGYNHILWGIIKNYLIYKKIH